MNPIVLQLTTAQISQLVKAYQDFSVPHKDPYKTHFFKVRSTSISVYTTGKVLFQGQEAAVLAKDWQTATNLSARKSKPATKVDQSFTTVGSDEVGNGSYFGGIAVVASFVKPEQHQRLKALGVGDSKTLTDQKILQLAPILEKEIDHQALLLSPQKYNEVVPARYNAVSVKVALHNQAIFLLLKRIERPEQIIIDAFTSDANYHKYLKKESNHFDQAVSLIEKAEGQCLAVAVSSIIARSLFLNQLKELGQKVGYQLPSGAGTTSDKVASQILAAYGQAGLEQTAKLHFKNTEKAAQLLRRS
ncbi:ribonuclease HIII [Streptococcus ovuberis]|uniref:Ribonuclease HIII n=1 Tax=Streptococcus ovuberis TaxID=1936207 RepID=A0A7X6MXJ1_9STRE|nr:ribonuclease HIII [Streptococcus ovuberis]NKZ19574.1 ribonuclease HIII [Streptococcus ovuberis]